MSAKKYLKIPAAEQQANKIKNEAEDKLWCALKRHIMKERQRKKQLEEAEFKEEQLRKEREASQISTLGETREQIQRVDNQLIDLKNKKQQLFLQLKKLLVNEDVSKRQQMTEFFKHNNTPPQSIYLPPKLDEGRRNEMGRAILWNKSAQYGQQTHSYPPSHWRPPTGPYPTAYPNYEHQSRPELKPSQQQQQQMPPRAVYQINIDQSPQMVPQSQQQKSGPISIEKINDRNYSMELGKDMRGVPQQQQQQHPATHRRHQIVGQTQNQSQGVQQQQQQQQQQQHPPQPVRTQQQVQIMFPKRNY
ncbi:unnamed protein product [Diamesa tonsa]